MLVPVRKLSFLFLFCSSAGLLMAQEVIVPEETRFVYQKEISGGITLHSRGWGANFRYSKFNTNFKKFSLDVDLVKMKHPKEVKLVNASVNDAKPYVYGKKNFLMVLRTGAAFHRLVFDKAPKDGVEINFTYGGGFSTALLKPVYLEIWQESTPFGGIKTSTEKYDENKHSQNQIIGAGPFLKGFDEIKPVPGLYLKTGLNFDWSSNDEKIRSLEAGVVFDAFINRLPVMAELEKEAINKQTFISFYATLNFGKKS